MSALSSGNIDKMNILQVKKYYHLIKLESQNKLSLHILLFLNEAFEKQIETSETQGEKQVQALEEHGKQLVKSNAFAEREEQSVPLDKKKGIL